MRNPILSLLAAALLAACASDPAAPDATVRVQPDGESAVLITNTDDEPVYYLIFNSEAFASWAPCTSPADCPEIAPGQTVRVEYAQIELWAPDSREAKLLWWQFRRAGEGYVEAGTGSTRVQLR